MAKAILEKAINVTGSHGVQLHCTEFRAAPADESELVGLSAGRSRLALPAVRADGSGRAVGHGLPAGRRDDDRPNGYVVEPRYIGDIVFGIHNDGLRVQR